MRNSFNFETEPFEFDPEFDEYEEGQPDAYSEFDKEGLFDTELDSELVGAGFRPIPVENPGGGRIKDKSLPSSSDIVFVKGAFSNKVPLHRLAAAALEVLVRAARADGIQPPLLLPTGSKSGFRDPKQQAMAWQRAVKKYGSPQEARKWVAPPGGSAHQTGRAIDFYLGGKNSSANVARLKMLPAYKWMVANAKRFGFYPYPGEPWHWEYNPSAARQSEVYPESYEELELWNGYEFEDEGVDMQWESDESFESEDQYEDEGIDVYSEFDEGLFNSELGQSKQAQIRSTSVSDMPQGPFGTLTITAPQQFRFTYVFTPEDVLWTARFIVGEAGGRDDLDNQAVIWAMFNRYAFFAHKVKKWDKFHKFIRAYSTTLQPVLSNWKAAKRHMHKPQFVRTGGYYKSPPAPPGIPRGQLEGFLKLQATPWSQLPQGARSLAERAMKGQILNPIGNASEFGSTYVYFHDKYHRYPSDGEWRQYTEAFARDRGWIWIGPVVGLNQKKNAFFIDKRVANLPPDTVRVVLSGR